MRIYVALRTAPDLRSGSVLIGAFSTEDRARAACQAEEDEDAADSGLPVIPLTWSGISATTRDSHVYDIFQGDLDQRST